MKHSAIEIRQSTDFPSKMSCDTGVILCALTLGSVSKVLFAGITLCQLQFSLFVMLGVVLVAGVLK